MSGVRPSGKRSKRLLAAALYYGFARYLPPTNVVGGPLFTAIRVRLVRELLDIAGDHIDISRMVYLGRGDGIVIGSNSGIGIGSELHGPLLVGSHVMVSPQVMIHTRNHRHADTSQPIARQGYCDPQQVVVEDDVWIGARAIILPGVTIGRGSIVGAGTVLSRSVPPYSIVAGNPGRVVRCRIR